MFFSKATPEHLEKERLMKAKLTVKADVHTPTNSPIFVLPVTDNKKKDSLKKKKTIAKQLELELDEIQLIQTETIVLSPKNEELNSPVSQKKPRWSMKIQLQSNNASTSGKLNAYFQIMCLKNLSYDDNRSKIVSWISSG